MTKPQLRVLAIVLSGLIVLVLFAGLDNLPRKLHADIAAEQQSLAKAEKDFQSAREEVSRDLAAEPDLFRVHAMATVFPQRLLRAESNLRTARQDMTALAALNKANRRTDREKAEQLLRRERGMRTAGLADAQAVERESRSWIERKKHL